MKKEIKVVAFGSFDPLHKGHIYYLKQAKKLGDKLFVIVSSDEKIKFLKSRHSWQNQEVRARQVKKLGIADKVLIGESTREYTLLDKIKPDVIALGYDQKIPESLKKEVKKYKIVTLKPYKPEIYKSSKLAPSSSG